MLLFSFSAKQLQKNSLHKFQKVQISVIDHCPLILSQFPPIHLPGAVRGGGRRAAGSPLQRAAGAGEAAAAGLQTRHAEVPARPYRAAGQRPLRPAGALQRQWVS